MDFGEKRRRHLSVAMRKSRGHGQAARLDSPPGTAALLGAYHAAHFALIHVNTPVTARRVQRDQADSRRLPSFVFTGDGFPIASYP